MHLGLWLGRNGNFLCEPSILYKVFKISTSLSTVQFLEVFPIQYSWSAGKERLGNGTGNDDQIFTITTVIHGVAKSRTRLSDWTELNWTERLSEGQVGCCSSRHFVLIPGQKKQHGSMWKYCSRDQTHVSCIGRQILNTKPPGKPWTTLLKKIFELIRCLPSWLSSTSLPGQKEPNSILR